MNRPQLDITENKICSMCQQEKSLDSFYETSRALKDGTRQKYRYAHCRECHYLKTKEWSAKNPDVKKAINKRMAEKNRPYKLLYMKEYHRVKGRPPQTEEQKHKRREARKNDPERFARYRSKHFSKPDKRLKNALWHANRRTKIRQIPGSFTQQEWQDICAKYGGKCLRCDEIKPLTIDHVMPLSLGGTNYADNVQPLCGPCNSTKWASHIDYRRPV